MRPFSLIVRRELRLALRRKGDALNVLVFFMVVASLFPLGVGPEPNQLRVMGGGVAWIAALLAAVLSLPRLFAADYADGTLEQMLVSPQPLAVIVLAKIAAHWLLSGLPLALVAPLIGLLAFVFGYSILRILEFSFKMVRGIDGPWIGLRNYELVLGQALFWDSVGHNLLLLLAIPVMVVIALLISLLLYERLRGWKLVRTLVFVPLVLR